MTLEILQKEMIAAMKAKDKIRKDAISSLIGAIKKVAIDEKCRENIPEELVNRVILKEKKTMQDMIDTCPADRTETLAEYNQKMNIINEFIPKMMTEEEIKDKIYEVVSMQDIVDGNKGKIMKVIAPVFKGKAEMKAVSQIVTEICSKVK